MPVDPPDNASPRPPVQATVSGQGTLLPYSGSPNAFELWRWTLGPNQSHHKDIHAPGTKELMHVLQGEISLQIGEEVVTLQAGDAIAFDGDVQHSLTSSGVDGATFTHTVFEPGAWTKI